MTSSSAGARQPRHGDIQLTGEALLRLGMRLYRFELETLDSLRVPLSIRQYYILDRVDHHITSMTELAALAHRRAPTISRSVDSLVRQGLLARHISPSDRRAATLKMTPVGTTVLDEARLALRALEATVGEYFDLVPDPLHLVSAVDRFYVATEPHLRPVSHRAMRLDPGLAIDTIL